MKIQVMTYASSHMTHESIINFHLKNTDSSIFNYFNCRKNNYVHFLPIFTKYLQSLKVIMNTEYTLHKERKLKIKVTIII